MVAIYWCPRARGTILNWEMNGICLYGHTVGFICFCWYTLTAMLHYIVSLFPQANITGWIMTHMNMRLRRNVSLNRDTLSQRTEHLNLRLHTIHTIFTWDRWLSIGRKIYSCLYLVEGNTLHRMQNATTRWCSRQSKNVLKYAIW